MSDDDNSIIGHHENLMLFEEPVAVDDFISKTQHRYSFTPGQSDPHTERYSFSIPSTAIHWLSSFLQLSFVIRVIDHDGSVVKDEKWKSALLNYAGSWISSLSLKIGDTVIELSHATYGTKCFLNQMLTTSESYRQRFFRDTSYYETFHPSGNEMGFLDTQLKANPGLKTRIVATSESDKIFVLLTVPLEISKTHLLIPPNLSVTLDLQFHPAKYLINAPEKISSTDGRAEQVYFEPKYDIQNIQLICDKYVLKHELQTRYLRAITTGAHPRYFFERDTILGPFAIPEGRREFSMFIGKTKYPQAISVIFMDKKSVQGSYLHSPQMFNHLSTTDCHVLYGGIRYPADGLKCNFTNPDQNCLEAYSAFLRHCSQKSRSNNPTFSPDITYQSWINCLPVFCFRINPNLHNQPCKANNLVDDLQIHFNFDADTTGDHCAFIIISQLSTVTVDRYNICRTDYIPNAIA